MPAGDNWPDSILQIISVVSAIVTPLLVAFFGYFNAQRIEAVRTGYDYLEYKLEKLQAAYEKTDVALDANLAKMISSQLQDRHHSTRSTWERIRHYLSPTRDAEVKRIDGVGDKINKIYVEFGNAQQQGKTYRIENEEDFGSLLYLYHDSVRKILAEELFEVVTILERARG